MVMHDTCFTLLQEQVKHPSEQATYGRVPECFTHPAVKRRNRPTNPQVRGCFTCFPLRGVRDARAHAHTRGARS